MQHTHLAARAKTIGITALLTTALATSALAGDKEKTEEVTPFELSEVQVSSPTIKKVQRLATDYLLGLDADRLVSPYLREAGLQPEVESYTNWENTGLDGHICGHYLSGLASMYAATGDARLKERLDYTVAQLKNAQDVAPDAYLCGVPGGKVMWNEISKGSIHAGAFSLNDKWVPLYNLHKIMAGLRDAYTLGKNNKAKDMFLKLCNWFLGITKNLSDSQLQDMLVSEHGGLNEVFADAYDMTGNKKYITMARKLTHNTVLTPLLKHEDKLTGMHANTQIPKVIGIMRIAHLTHDSEWHYASDAFWHNVVDHRTVSIGGNSVREHFHPSNDFSSMIESEQGPETCNTLNMLRLTKQLFLEEPDANYMDYYERALLNHILSSINSIQGGFVYFTPMRPGHYRVYSQPQTCMWCCVGSGLENHSKYGEMVYAHRGKQELFVNTYLPSTLTWKDNNVTLTQEGNFPWDDEVRMTVKSKKADKHWTLKLRKPSWTDEMKLSLNGQTLDIEPDKSGYFNIDRIWGQGDVIEIKMPMHVSAEELPDGSGYFSFLNGPMVLAADMGKENQLGLYADDSRGGHIANGPKLTLDEAPVIIADKENVASNIIKTEDGKAWQITNLMPEKYANLRLVPFVNLSEHRYDIYFQTMDKKAYQERREELARLERERKELDARTVDAVICGEQQPETDHRFAHEASSSGGDADNIHWRETRSWFSYVLNANGADKVAISFLQSPNREAKVLCNGRVVGNMLMGADGKKTLEFALPEKATEVEVRIEAVSTRSPRVYEVRCLKNK